MKIVRYGIAVGLLAGLGACSNMMGSSGSSQSVAVAPPPAVAPDMVRQVQAKLRDGGYYKQGAVDGVWGAGTQASVRSFQHDHNLTANGQLDVPTLQALNLASSAPDTTRDNATTQPNYNAPTQPNYNTPTQPDYNAPPPARTTGPAPPR